MIRQLRFLALLSIFLHACVSASASPPTLTPVPPIPTATLTPSPLPPTPETPQPTQTPAPSQPISRVMIVTFDGLRPDAIDAADMTNVKALMQSGAYTLHAQTIMPSTTLPAHASLVTGACPAKHVARWNEYVPQNGYALGTDIFDLTRSVGLRTVLVVGKEKLRQITESTDFFGFVDNTDEEKDITTLDNMAVEQIQLGFGLMLVHFPDGDVVGHEYGWLSKQQLRAYHTNDQSFGQFIKVMKSSGYYDGTLFIITSDHGGALTDPPHGTDIPEAMTIPWIISGPQVVPGELKTQVYIMDTAATVAFALGLPMQPEWDGAPVYEAFGLPVDPLRQGGCTGVTP
ncbi:MAG: alkaline phosphatase family protein [Chloroflexi bacterium]|nr:alkaline phosphatase family protein [Chloroflexota bacterium]MBI3170698.1 alkaline phosphatase family protein [Chloroflexota bacterium]